jgi:hypothetical protein
LVSEASLHSVVIDVVRSLSQHGIRKLVIVTTRTEGMAGLGARVIRAAVVFSPDQARGQLVEHVNTPRCGLACEIEISLALKPAPGTGRADAL